MAQVPPVAAMSSPPKSPRFVRKKHQSRSQDIGAAKRILLASPANSDGQRGDREDERDQCVDSMWVDRPDTSREMTGSVRWL
jgi:hypothetical protein